VLDSRYNISPKTSFYRVQGLHHTNALKRLCTVCQVYVTQLSQTSMRRVPDLRDNISPKTSLYRGAGLHDTTALKGLCAVCHIYVTVFPL